MANLFIGCEEFRKLFKAEIEFLPKPLEPCCRECHVNDCLIFVRPFRNNERNTDWDICVEAEVCCEMYDFVRALPREWWINYAKEKGFYATRNDGRGYSFTDTPEKDTDRPSSQTRRSSAQVTKERVKAAIRKQDDDERAGGLSGYLKRR